MPDDDQSKCVLELCDRALELPDDEREQFLASSCYNDTQLRASVDSVLIAVGKASRFLGKDVNTATESIDLVGRQIGSYRIKERLGEGFDQQVAIKFVHGHILANELIKRFNAERQIETDGNSDYPAWRPHIVLWN